MFLRKATALLGFAELAQKLNSNPAELCQRAGIVPTLLETPEQFFPCRSFYQLLELAAEYTGRSDFGLLLADQPNVPLMGATGFLIQHSPDVRTALNELIKYNHIHDQGGDLEIMQEGQSAYLLYKFQDANPEETIQALERAARVGVNLLKALCGPTWQLEAVYFQHQAQSSLPTYIKLLGTNQIYFKQDISGLIFDARLLDIKISASNHYLHHMLQTYVESLNSSHPYDTLFQVEQLIRQLLSTGSCSLERIAETLNLNPRTLQRELRAKGTSFSKLLENIRLELAKKYLLETRLTLAQLAELLGYAELSTFSRAFKRGVGTSPQSWRLSQTSALIGIDYHL